MNDILITGIVFFSIYKIIELSVMQRNRKHLIEKMSQISPEALESNINSLNVTLNDKSKGNRFSSLRWGALLFSVGLGWLVGEVIYHDANMDHDSAVISTTAICAGIALIVVYFNERNAYKVKKEE
jgi:hypothetical protein